MARQLTLAPVLHRVVDDLEMGILPDGTPYLTARALARLCGVAPSLIITLGKDWTKMHHTARNRKIQELLDLGGFTGEELYVQVEANGVTHHAHPDSVCSAIIEYYAYHVSPGRPEAMEAFRRLARKSLKLYIYATLGYDPIRQAIDSMRHHYDRLMLNPMPKGFFSVFVESAELQMKAIRAGLAVGADTVPDISIGKAWGSHWNADNLEDQYGQRMRYPHEYPADYPQSAAAIEAWVYPLSALGEFRQWLQDEYLPVKFPGYLNGKIRKKQISNDQAEKVLDAFCDNPPPPQLPE